MKLCTYKNGQERSLKGIVYSSSLHEETISFWVAVVDRYNAPQTTGISLYERLMTDTFTQYS